MRIPTFTALAIAAAGVFASVPSRATIIERIVAIVEDKAIMLSELKDRSRPYLMRVYVEVPGGAQRSGMVSQVYKMVLDHIIDEELTRRAADTAKLSVSDDEVQRSLELVAAQNQLSLEELFAEARRNGQSDATYREEIRRQVLQMKLIELRLQGRIRPSAAEITAAYEAFRMEERKRLSYRVAKLNLGKVLDPATTAGKEQFELSKRILKSAHSGGDFSALVRSYSTDATTREAGGLLPAAVPGKLPEGAERVIQGLEVGQVSEPLRINGEFWILKLVERAASELPPFQAVERELSNRVYMQKLDCAQRDWLQSLRKRSHVEIRL